MHSWKYHKKIIYKKKNVVAAKTLLKKLAVEILEICLKI